MTRPTPASTALVELAGKEWVRHKILKVGIEAQIRAKVEAEMAVNLRNSLYRVAAALWTAIDGDATKSALRLVTTQDRRTFESILALLKTNKGGVPA